MLRHSSPNAAFPIFLDHGSVRNEIPRGRRRQQSAIAEFTRATLQTRESHIILQRATALCAEALDAPFATIMEFVAADQTLLVRAGFGWPDTIEQTAFAADGLSPAGRAFLTGQAIAADYGTDKGRFETPELPADRGIRRSISIRIERGGQGGGYFGVLQVSSPDSGRFEEAEVACLAGCADLVGLAIERLREDTRLREALDHQAMLTREMGHRVKNSLASVVAMLRIQAFGTHSNEARRALEEAGSRVAAIAQVHDHLSRAAEIGFIDVAVFLNDFCRRLQRVAGTNVLRCKADSVRLSADHAVPLGLLINELVSNAVKHAYPGRKGTIDIGAHDINGCLQLSVSDQGVGLPEGFDIDQRRTSLGFRMIKGMVQQLRGRLNVGSNQPTGTRVLFELPILPGRDGVAPAAALVTADHQALDAAG